MQLAQPDWLWFLAALPLLAVWGALERAKRVRDWSALGQGGRPARDGSTRWLLAAAVLIVALARPRWGRLDEPPLPPGRDLVLAIDVSRSMGAGDAVPDRLGVAVESAESLIAALGHEGGNRVAVVAFAGRGVLRCPLTRDLDAAVEILRSLRAGEVRPGGTDLGAGLIAALEAFDDHDREGGRSVVVFSDGEDHAGAWKMAVERSRDQGVIVHTVAIGDAETGHPVPSQPGALRAPIRYRGGIVLSRRSDEALAAIARVTGGAFVPLGLAMTDLGRLYRSRIEPTALAFREGNLAPERAERFPLFVAASLAATLAASWPGRPRPSRLRTVALVSALAALLAGAAPGEGPVGTVARGRAAYASGRYDEALDAFRQAILLAPGHPVPAYDAAATLFRLGRHDEAESLYVDARDRADAALRTKIDYALGNTALARGDLASAIRRYDDCLASTAPGAVLDQVRQDAALNRRFVEEQSRHTPTPPDSGEGSDSKRSTGRAEENPPANDDGRSERVPGQGGGTPNKPPAGPGGFNGAGGSGPTPPEAGSPEDQLSRALENVREARKRKIEESTTRADREDGKDW